MDQGLHPVITELRAIQEQLQIEFNETLNVLIKRIKSEKLERLRQQVG